MMWLSVFGIEFSGNFESRRAISAKSRRTGTAIISYILPTGCSVTKMVTVTPLPSAITGSTQVCVGATTLLGDPVSGGAWSSGALGIAAIGSAGSLSGVV